MVEYKGGKQIEHSLSLFRNLGLPPKRTAKTNHCRTVSELRFCEVFDSYGLPLHWYKPCLWWPRGAIAKSTIVYLFLLYILVFCTYFFNLGRVFILMWIVSKVKFHLF